MHYVTTRNSITARLRFYFLFILKLFEIFSITLYDQLSSVMYNNAIGVPFIKRSLSLIKLLKRKKVSKVESLEESKLQLSRRFIVLL